MAKHIHDDATTLDLISDADAAVVGETSGEPFPRRGAPYGPGPHVAVPDVYSPGAVGWVERRVKPILGESDLELESDAIVEGITKQRIQELRNAAPPQDKSKYARAIAAIESAHQKSVKAAVATNDGNDTVMFTKP